MNCICHCHKYYQDFTRPVFFSCHILSTNMNNLLTSSKMISCEEDKLCCLLILDLTGWPSEIRRHSRKLFLVLSLSLLMDVLWSFGLEIVSQALANHCTMGGAQPYFTLDQDDDGTMAPVNMPICHAFHYGDKHQRL